MAIPPPHMKARKRFGQNFLVNDHIINSIVDAINPQEGDILVEIGPGHAALTRPVLERAKALTAIELDRDLAERLRHDPFLKGLKLIESDALRVDFSKLEGAGKLRVFGNLPYNITSPLIFHLLSFEGIIDMHFMLQKEVVERLAAGPGSKDYGRLTVMAQFHAKVIPVLTVPPSAFVPPPKVMSAVVRLKPKALTPEERALSPFLNKITTTAFAARRKTIRNSLSPLFEPQELEQLGIDLQSRAEDLALQTFVELAKLLKSKRSLEEILAEEEQQIQLKKDKRIAKLHASADEGFDDSAYDAPADFSDEEVEAALKASSEANKAQADDAQELKANSASMGKPLTAKERSILKKAQMRQRKKEFDCNDINADLQEFAMKADDPLVEVFERNSEYYESKRVLIVGQIPSLQLLPALIKTSAAYVLTDNYETAQGLSAMMGIKLGHSAFECASKKHVSVFFADGADERLDSAIGEIDCLVLFLNKTKSLSQKLLYCLQKHLNEKVDILLMGSNAIGGKSADSLLKSAAEVYKIDTARKCTVFLAKLNANAKISDAKPLSDVKFGGLTLKQEQGLFSQGELDQGTKLLLNAMHRDLSGEKVLKDSSKLEDLSTADLKSLKEIPGAAHAQVLDLGCGSGIIGLSLAARGFNNVLCSDISATALNSTVSNAKLNGLNVNTMACNMLPSADELEKAQLNVPGGKFNIIATNPPFHQGVNRTTAQTLNMIKQAKDALTADGVLYLVGNTCLHYEEPLNEAFSRVEVIAATTKFMVYKAYNG